MGCSLCSHVYTLDASSSLLLLVCVHVHGGVRLWAGTRRRRLTKCSLPAAWLPLPTFAGVGPEQGPTVSDAMIASHRRPASASLSLTPLLRMQYAVCKPAPRWIRLIDRVTTPLFGGPRHGSMPRLTAFARRAASSFPFPPRRAISWHPDSRRPCHVNRRHARGRQGQRPARQSRPPQVAQRVPQVQGPARQV